MEGVQVEISGMDINKFMLYSKLSKYSEATQNKIMAQHDQLVMENGKNKSGKKIPMDTTKYTDTIKSLKAKISLLE